MEKFQCIECGWITEDNTKSILHMKMVHNMDLKDEINIAKFVCDMCRYSISNMSKLKDHMIEVLGKEKYGWWTGDIKIEFSCDECDIEFDNGTDLRKHKEKVHDHINNIVFKQKNDTIIKEEVTETQEETEEEGEVIEQGFTDRYYGDDGNNESRGAQ